MNTQSNIFDKADLYSRMAVGSVQCVPDFDFQQETSSSSMPFEADSSKAWYPDQIPDLSYSYLVSSRSLTTQFFEYKEPSVKELIEKVKCLDWPFAQDMGQRLEYLDLTSHEDFPDQAPISPNSLRAFIEFVCSIPKLVYPAIVLTYSGNIRAEWTRTQDKHFAVEFLDTNQVRFVVFAPDPQNPFEVSRASGIASIDSVLTLVHPYKVSSWIFNRPGRYK